MKQNMPTPAYAPQQTAYIQPCAGQLSYKSLLVKKNSAQMVPLQLVETSWSFLGGGENAKW